VDIRKLANTVDDLLRKTKTPIKVAVMGCEVNGPGEAKDADVGIAAGVGRAVIFRKGRKVRIVAEADMLAALMEEIEKAEAEIAPTVNAQAAAAERPHD
jgi:(E)-4-hydroxy-3-methylbut-2-enyl-diphosphate synthase